MTRNKVIGKTNWNKKQWSTGALHITGLCALRGLKKKLLAQHQSPRPPEPYVQWLFMATKEYMQESMVLVMMPMQPCTPQMRGTPCRCAPHGSVGTRSGPGTPRPRPPGPVFFVCLWSCLPFVICSLATDNCYAWRTRLRKRRVRSSLGL